jgi:hypothetical protein
MRAVLEARFCAAWLVGLVLLGCGLQHESPRRAGPVAVLSGRVSLAMGEALPEYASLDLANRPLHEHSLPGVPPACAAANDAARRPVQLTSEGLLGGVVVAASDFNRFRERGPELHRVSIEGCRLRPAVLAAQAGDFLELENRDQFAFEPLIGPTFTPRALGPGKKVRLPLLPGSVDSILCSRAAPCGRTDLLVFFHPVYAVTDAQGRFRIPNFPASELVRVSAWHPLFEESQTEVWLEPGERASIELVLRPKRRFVPVAPGATPAPGAPLPP